MKVILYMAVSANGMIAKLDDDTGWISRKEWDSYSAIARKAGNIVVGRRTYSILTKQPEFKELKGVKLVAVSKKHSLRMVDRDHSIAVSPKAALRLLKGFSKVVVAGGGILNKSFMKENLIDEVYLDVEPIILGKGIKLFSDADFSAKLELVGTRKISDNEIQLHYRVKK
ncbi:MAG: dihydrofolate reductase [Candidatus Micrarchaeota archaeon]|nr:dihydrofolate reductase [Candidatus Micrarchaeota archaeon]